MAFYQVVNFFYDSDNDNIRIQFTVYSEAQYETANQDDNPYDVYEAQIFLDALKEKIGFIQPESMDGTYPHKVYGRDLGQFPDATVQFPLTDAPASYP